MCPNNPAMYRDVRTIEEMERIRAERLREIEQLRGDGVEPEPRALLDTHEKQVSWRLYWDTENLEAIDKRIEEIRLERLEDADPEMYAWIVRLRYDSARSRSYGECLKWIRDGEWAMQEMTLELARELAGRSLEHGERLEGSHNLGAPRSG